MVIKDLITFGVLRYSRNQYLNILDAAAQQLLVMIDGNCVNGEAMHINTKAMQSVLSQVEGEYEFVLALNESAFSAWQDEYQKAEFHDRIQGLVLAETSPTIVQVNPNSIEYLNDILGE
jgi:hypothetical protein